VDVPQGSYRAISLCWYLRAKILNYHWVFRLWKLPLLYYYILAVQNDSIKILNRRYTVVPNILMTNIIYKFLVAAI